MVSNKVQITSDYSEKKKVFKTKALLFIIFTILFAVFIANTVFSATIKGQDLSYLDDSAIQGYENGSYINNGQYYSGAKYGSANASVSEQIGNAASCATVSNLVDSKNLSQVNFSENNVFFTKYASANWDGRTNVGQGYFGWKKGNATQRQGTLQNCAYIYVELTGNMLTLAKTGNLNVSLSGIVGAESGDDQTFCYGMTYTNSLSLFNVTSSLNDFQNQMKTHSGTRYTTKAGEWDATLNSMNIDTVVASYDKLYLVVAVAGHSEYGNFIGGRVPSAYLKNVTLSFELKNKYTVTFNKSTGGNLDKSKAEIDKVAGTASCTATPAAGYYWSKWTKGNTASVHTTSDTITVNVIDCLSQTTYMANFSAITYTIQFDFKGKPINGAFPNQTVVADGESSVLGAPESEGSAFAGWMRTSSQTTVDFTKDSKIKPCNLDSTKAANVTITLYALWQVATATAGSGITSIVANPSAYSMYEDVTYTVTANKSGYTLVGVYAKYTSGDLNGVDIDLVQSDNKWILHGICGNCTLYPRWRANSSFNVTQCDITFDPNGGTMYKPNGTQVSSFVFRWLYGESYTHAYFPYATKSGYTFCGWTTSRDGSSFVNSISTTTNYKNKTLYAKWINNTLLSENWGAERRTFKDSQVNGWTDHGKITATANLDASIKNVLSLSGYYDVGYSMNITSDFRTDSATAQSGWTSNTYSSETRYVIKGTEKAYTKIDEKGNSSGGTKESKKTGKAHGHGKLDGESYTVTGYTIGAYAIETGTLQSTATTLEFSIARQYKHVGGSSYGVEYCSVCNAGNFHYWSSISYSIKLTGATRKGTRTNSVEITYNPNGADGSEYKTRVASGQNVYLAPSNFWDRNGYYFAGWGASPTTSITNVVSGTVNLSSDKTYYAIWAPNQYPIITYDVFTDDKYKKEGANSQYGVEILTAWYYKYNSNITLNTSATNSIAGNVGSASGKNKNYTGFTDDGLASWYILTQKPTQSNNWVYAQGTQGTSIGADNTIGPKYAYFLRNMKAPTVTITGQSTVYGLSEINLEKSGFITKTLDLGTRSVFFETVWYKGASNDAVSFYVAGTPVIYTYKESESYACGLTASTTIGGVTLSTYKKSDTANYNIEPLSLTLEYDGSNETEYNGQTQKFTFKVAVDETATYYALGGRVLTASELAIVKNSLAKEQEQGAAWYNTSGLFEANGLWNYGYGLNAKLISITFTPNLGSGNYSGSIDNGRILFRDAGEYHIGGLDLACVKGNPAIDEYSKSTSTLSTTNNNYRWKTGLSGDSITAKITPATLDIYAVYSAKTYGVLSDPVTEVTQDYTMITENELFEYDNNIDKSIVRTKKAFLGVEIIDEDYNTFYGILSQLLKRAPGQQKGTYDVYFDLFGLGDNAPLAALYNNYGIVLGGANSTLTSFSSVENGTKGGGINLYWVTASGREETFNLTVANENNPFRNFTVSANALSSVQSYANTDALKSVVKNFEILPAKISGVSTTGNGNSYIYDGTKKGVSFSFDFPTVDVSYGVQRTSFYFVKVPAGADNATKNALAAEAKRALSEGKTSCVFQGETYTFGISAEATSESANTRTLAFQRISAGLYDVLIFQTSNPDFDLTGYTNIHWTIDKIGISVSKEESLSNVFGNIDYGGYKFKFYNVAAGDSVAISAVKTSPDNTGFRYEDFANEIKDVKNDQEYALYGLYAGTYKVKFDIKSNNSTDDGNDALYGTPYGVNYTIDTSETSWDVTARTLSAVLSGANGEKVYLNTGYTSTVTINNFFADGFFTEDITAKGTSDNIKVSAEKIRSDLTDGITFDTTLSGTELTQGEFNFAATGEVKFEFTAYDAQKYTPSVNSVSFVYGGKEYANYSLTKKGVELTIKPKDIEVKWSLSGAPDGVYRYRGRLTAFIPSSTTDSRIP